MADEHSMDHDSKEAIDVEEHITSKPGAKRRASRAGTRSVASLTPEQLARKRANDREAQRSIRQRTKTHIEELEQRIRELSYDQDGRDFEQINRRNAELEEELRQLSELLGRSEGSMGSSPDLNSSSFASRYTMDILETPHPLAYLPSWGSQHIEGPKSSGLSPPTSNAGDLLSSFAPDNSGLPSGFPDAGSARSATFNQAEVSKSDLGSPQTGPVQIAREDSISRPQVGRSRSYPNGSFELPACIVPLVINGPVDGIGLSLMPNHSPVNRPLMVNANEMHQSQPPTSHPLTLNQRLDPTGLQKQNSNAYEMSVSIVGKHASAASEIPVQLLPPADPVANIVQALVQRQRSLATEHIFGSQLIGPPQPDFNPIVGSEISRSNHPVPSILSDLFKRLEFVGFAEKAAAFLLVYYFVQWQILPGQETYQNMPDWFRPRHQARVTAHPLWTSFLIWGGLRDAAMQDQDRYATEEFMNLYQNCVTVNWPFRDEDILVCVGDEVRVTDAFRRHFETLGNWSLSEPFHRRYPELRDLYRLA